MSTSIATIDDVILLPTLTNHMYFDVINMLNRELSIGKKRAVVISNPCGGNKPCCIIISEHSEVIERVTPLARRWPDRFVVQNGMLGEFTSKKDAKSGRSTSKESDPSTKLPTRSDDNAWKIDGTSELTSLLAQYLAENVELRLRVSAFTATKLDVDFFFPLHSFESKIRHYCESAFRNAEFSGDRRKSIVKRILSLKQSFDRNSQEHDIDECVANTFKKIYEMNSFKVSLFNEVKKEYSTVTSVQTKISRIDHTKDLLVMQVARRGEDAKTLRSWIKTHKNLDIESARSEPVALKVGDICTSPAVKGSNLKVERLEQTVFFPMSDKVTSLNCVMVLSGGTVESGSSGSTVFDSKGRVAAMVVGRARTDSGYHVLAVPLSPTKSERKRLSTE